MGKVEFCVGNKVRVMVAKGDGCLVMGTIGTVTKVSKSIAGLNVLVESYSGRTYWYAQEELEMATPPTYALPSKKSKLVRTNTKIKHEDGNMYNILLEPCMDLA